MVYFNWRIYLHFSEIKNLYYCVIPPFFLKYIHKYMNLKGLTNDLKLKPTDQPLIL